MGDFTHFDAEGGSRMVDVSAKPVSARRAVAAARVKMQPATLEKIRSRQFAKGDVLEVARLAGIMAAKRTGGLIPLCHPLPIESVALRFEFLDAETVAIEAEVAITARTGVEMEALTAAAIAALTIYDMCKSQDRGMVIEGLQLEGKSGCRSGTYRRQPAANRP